MSQTPANAEQSGFIVRNARPSDSDAINQLCVEAYLEFRRTVGEVNWQRLRETLSQASDLADEGELIVAADSSGVLGIVLYKPPDRDKGAAPKSAWLQTLAVSPLHRGKGIGQSLTRECINRARKDGPAASA